MSNGEVGVSVALVVSGMYTGEDYIDLLRTRIPYDDLYTATYTGIKMPFEPDFRMDEPVNHYHPIHDINPYPDGESNGRRRILALPDEKIPTHLKKLKAPSAHWYKQIMLHAWVCDQIQADVVVRARFETIVSNQIDWQEWIDKCRDDEITIGFNTRSNGKNLYHHELERTKSKVDSFYINDALIIHPKHCLDWDYINHLYNKKKLRGAEEGWYQVLSESQGHYHLSYHGGAYSAKDWELVKDAERLHYIID
tara:strand:- start:448 stop:1203 length:756 start_codon:yes stop_codon:yes gene_type:complete